MKIAGLDIGTTGCKCTVFDENGKYLDKAYHSYPVQRNLSGHEIDVEALTEAVFEVIREMAADYPDIAALGVTSLGESFVCVDEEDHPMHASMIYTDPRGLDECQRLIGMLGERKITEISGLRPHESYSISKMMWMKEHRPEIWAKTRHIFLMQDYVVYCLSGVEQIDYSLASRTMALDVRNLCWSEEIFAAAGIDPKLLSKVVPTGTIAGKITAATAERTGLSPETKIVSISHDQIAAAVGSGAFSSEIAVDGAGTVECLTPVFDGIPDAEETEQMYQGYYSLVPYVIPGKYVAYAFSYTGGALIQWCTETIAKQEAVLAAEERCSVNEYLERQYRQDHGEAADGPGSLLVLPYFAGAGTPYMDNGAKGAIIGMTMDTTAADIYHGCMEGVAYEMYVNARALNAAGVQYKEIHATGGGAKSETWMQMKADILNVPVVSLKTPDAGTVGSAILTGIAVGMFQDLEDAASHMVEVRKTFYPRPEKHEAYFEKYQKYERLYHAVRPLI
ncbi:MAG: FGGY-family carbohydrate kinase [Eubacteriales bacterium]|nr:FGGY-family carbohydrate kinase [Eubacteriales bacterium]